MFNVSGYLMAAFHHATLTECSSDEGIFRIFTVLMLTTLLILITLLRMNPNK